MSILENRFIQVHYEELPKIKKISGNNWGQIATRMEILKDTHTGALYCISSVDGANPMMTPLIGSDGKPLVDKSE